MTQRAKRATPADDAFSMIELLVTMLLLTIVLVGLAALQVSTIRQVTVSKTASEATRLAQLVMERYRSAPYATLQAFSVRAPTWWRERKKESGTDEMVRVGVDGDSDGPFTVESLHESVGGGELVTVRVTWTDINRGIESTPSQQYRQHSVTMSVQRYP